MKPRPETRRMFRRPLFVIAIAFGLGITLGRFVHLQIVYIAAAACLSFAAVLVFRFLRKDERKPDRRRRRTVAVVGIAAAMLGAFLSASVFDADDMGEADSASVWGRVYQTPYHTEYGDAVIYLDRATIDGRPSGNIKLYSKDAESLPEAGDTIGAQAEIVIPKGVRNPGGFDERTYLLSQSVRYKAYADDVHIAYKQGGFAIWAAQAKEYIQTVIDDVFDEDAAPLAKAMLLGDKSSLGEQTYSDFKDTGMAHVLAVSGLHAGILIAFVYFLLRLLRAGRKTRLIVTLLFIAAYAFVTGMTPSILRASVMAASLLIGTHFGRQTDALNHLSLAFIAALIINPADMFSAGFALSFGAVFGILTLGWQLQRAVLRSKPAWLHPPGRLLAASVGATVGTMPILAHTFHRVTTLGVLINLVVIPLASAAIVLSFTATLLGAVFAPLAVPFAWLGSLLLQGITAVVGGAATLPWMALDVPSPPWYFVLGVFALLFVISKYVRIKLKWKAAASAALAVVVAAAMLLARPPGMYIAFLDVGQGDAAFVRTAQGGEYFIDGGHIYSETEVVSYVRRNGISPDAAFVSHPDEDHISGLIALAEEGLLGKVYCSRQAKHTVSEMMPGVEVVALTAGDRVMLDEVTSALVLYPYPGAQSESANDDSLVMLIEYRGVKTLFTGDISGETETALFCGIGEVDIYKAAHHGSKHSSYALPLEALSPKYAVVSVGRNVHGHPHEWAMANLEENADAVYTTGDYCTVEFYINGGITANTYGGENGSE